MPSNFDISEEMILLNSLDEFFGYFIKETRINELTLILPDDTDLSKIESEIQFPYSPIEYQEIYIGNLLVTQLSHFANKIFTELIKRLDAFEINNDIALLDKGQNLNGWIHKLIKEREKVNSYNIFRFERELKLFISGNNIIRKEIPYIKILDREEVWGKIKMINEVRYHFFQEIIYLLQELNTRIMDKIILEKSHTLKFIEGSEKQYFLHELCLALTKSDFIIFDNTNSPEVFRNDFFAFFGQKPEESGYYIDKILTRKFAPQLLEKLYTTINNLSIKKKKELNRKN